MREVPRRQTLEELYRRTSTAAASRTALLDRSLQAWVVDYHHDRPNHGDYMAGRIPLQATRELKRRIQQTAD